MPAGSIFWIFSSSPQELPSNSLLASKIPLCFWGLCVSRAMAAKLKPAHALARVLSGSGHRFMPPGNRGVARNVGSTRTSTLQNAWAPKSLRDLDNSAPTLVHRKHSRVPRASV